MEVLEGQQDFAGVELGLTQGELLPLDVQHEVPATDVLHHEVDAGFSLEAGVQTEEERMPLPCGGKKDTLFRPRTVSDVLEIFLQQCRDFLTFPPRHYQ